MITKDKAAAVVMTLVEWGLAGGLCGGLLVALQQVLLVLGVAPEAALPGAAAAAAMATAAFHSAMSVALIGATAGVMASIGALIVVGSDLGLPTITGAAVLAGLAAGSFFSWMTASARRPLTRALTGLAAGLIAGALLSGLHAATGRNPGSLVLAMAVVALVGTLYEIAARWLIRGGRELLPHGLAAAVVSALIAAMVAAGIWLLGGTPTLAQDGTSHDLLGLIRGELPAGFLGGLLGGAGTGLILELLGFRLEEHS